MKNLKCKLRSENWNTVENFSINSINSHFNLNLKPKAKECAIVNTKTVKIQILDHLRSFFVRKKPYKFQRILKSS